MIATGGSGQRDGSDPTTVSPTSVAPVADRRTLLVVGPDLSATYPLPDTGVITIGRSRECEVRVDHPSISRRHLSIRVSADVIEVEDLGSANGSRFRDEYLVPAKPVRVRSGEVIDVGAVIVIVQERSEPLRRRRIWNHGLFEERVEEECARAARSGTSFALLRVRGGDAVEAAICESVRRIDVVGRYGPNDWEAILIEASRLEAEAIAARITERLPDSDVGIALFPADGRDPVSLDDAAAGAASRAPGPVGRLSDPVIGDSMVQLERLVQRVAESNISVLIVGETGVGKEVLAARIHKVSGRRERPFVRINSAALSETLLESELFGYEKGAFTGADRQKLGLLAAAHGGTVMLDEVGDLPETTQVKLLRVLEQREILPVGAVKPVPIDVRFLAATNRDLEQDVRRGRFRQDLYFRLAGITLRVPPLRQRPEEIPQLAAAFVVRASEEAKRPRGPALSDQALRLLSRYSWPGNIRELRNVIERAVLLCTGDAITAEHLPVDKMGDDPGTIRVGGAPRDSAPHIRATPTPPPKRAVTPATPSPASAGLRDEMERIERERILTALDECGGNQTQTARLLGISRSTLISRIEEYGIRRPRKRET